mgnify:CR=1 FL=1
MDIPGFPARKAALKLLDAVLRRGETLDVAAHGALQGVKGAADKALARALAGEVLRWLTDLDALIDSATRQALPDDAKPRSVLRLMLAGWLRLETPPHAVIATGLELLSGGPRRLAHGVFSALVRRGVSLPDYPTLPADVAERIRDADIVLPSLDAGDPCFFEHVNRPHPAITFDRMVDGMVHFRDRFAKPIWLEVFLLDGITALEPAVDQIAHHAARIRPDRIQLNTVTRPHAEGMALAVPPQVLAGLAERFEPKADVIADLGERGTGPQTDVAAEEILALLRRRPCAPDEIARGLGAHPLVVLKHLDKLLHQNRVALRAEGGRFFYHSPSDVCA